ncbi:hypothetical protein TSST111916_18995 [Tsukamurella strandjordii]|uniref:hypothetical protein n=1 Tax=Tsukamurella TaxID=2060 RepID=UPI001C7DEBAD|nr:hypothetical protein [Tsukamurella sp. TY48]GIZ97527.1 hypothetical protein TTY48_21390 [Tsukamurella sp. TY48]
MNHAKVAATIATIGILATGCSEKSAPLNERIFTDVICIKQYTAGIQNDCSTILKASTAELENCIPQKPPSPISSVQELAKYCPSVAARISSNTGYSGGSTAPTPAQGTDTNTESGNAAEAAPDSGNMSDLGDKVKMVGLGFLALLAVTGIGFWIKARREQQNRTAQRQHAADHGWHSDSN